MGIASSLKQAGLQAIDAEILLAHVLQVPRTVLLARAKEELSKEQEDLFQKFCARRKKGEPVAYILGKQEFYGKNFFVDPSVLIPRPSTEGLIDLTEKTIRTMRPEQTELDTDILGASWILKEKRPSVIVDIGTGSGAIAITLKRKFPNLRIIATDVSDEALAIAVRNAWTLGVSIEMRMGSLLAAVSDLTEFFFVVSNPPYIPEGTKLAPEVKEFEPHGALFAGSKGLSVIEPLIHECRKHPFCMGIALEFRKDQKDRIDSFLGD